MAQLNISTSYAATPALDAGWYDIYSSGDCQIQIGPNPADVTMGYPRKGKRLASGSVVTVYVGRGDLIGVIAAANGVFNYNYRAARIDMHGSYNNVACIGDSMVEQIHFDAARINTSAYNQFNMANAFSGQRALLVYNGGLSGQRSDQTLARMDQVLASGAGTLYIFEGVNDIGLAPYTDVNTGLTVAALDAGKTAAYNTIKKAQAALARGMRVIICGTPGTTGFSALMIGQCNVYNSMLRRYAERTRDVWFFDTASVLHNPLTAALGLVAFRANYMRTGEAGGVLTHEGTLGAYFAGKELAKIFKEVMPSISRFGVSNSFQYSTDQRGQLLPNPAFTGTAGTVGTGGTGTMPDSWTCARISGDTTTTFTTSIEARTDGNGNDVRVDYNASVAGAGLRMQLIGAFSYSSVAWLANDEYQMLSQIDVASGCVNLASIGANTESSDTLFVTQSWDLLGTASSGHGALPSTEAFSLDSATKELVVPPHSINGSYLQPRPFYALFAGAGTGTFRVHAPRLEIKPANV